MKFPFKLPKSRLGVTLWSVVITLLVSFGYFYVSLPALNFQSGDLYRFLGIACVVYFVSVFLLSGGGSALFRDYLEKSPLVASATFVESVNANAIGYHAMAEGQLSLQRA